MTPATARSHRRTQARNGTLPRRVSGPVRRPVALPGGATVVPRRGTTGILPRASRARHRLRLGRVRALPEHRMVDRLLRSRLWIWALGVMLGGIVAMQVSLLKLNSGISRAVETTATLERQNGDLEARIAALSATDHVQQGALQLGMLMPAAGDVDYLRPRPGDAARAVSAMQPPSADAAALLANQGIVPGSLGPAAPASTVVMPAATATPVTTPQPPATTTTATTGAAGTVPGQG
jgi:hypothetical protein